MKVLIIDRDRDNCDQMTAALEKAGAKVVCEPIKNKAAEILRAEKFDAIFLDPTPQANEMRAFIMNVRRSTNSFPPIIIMGHQLAAQQVMAAGGNDILNKPFSNELLVAKAANAVRISQVTAIMADEREDFPSRDGVIAKSAFNQLFITCLDRADRHGEQSSLIFIDIENLADIAQKDGAEAARKVAANLHRHISRARRTSDIAGHIKTGSFCLLLLRPAREDEPFLAASRFADSLKENHDLISTASTRAILKVSLLVVPTGEVPVEHSIGQDL